jgi:hypothetical protein
MNPVKIAAIILIISAGLVGSYFIIKNPIPPLPSGQTQDASALKPLVQNPLKWVENTVKSLTDNSPVERDNNIKTENKNTTNLTELVAKTMFSQMKNLDQGEKNPFQGQGFDPNDPQSQQLIQEALASIQDPAAFFNPSVEDKDLKILTDNSLSAKIKYLEEIREIIQKQFGDSNQYKKDAEEIIQEVNNDCFSTGSPKHQKLINTYQSLINNLIPVYVPSDWLDFHKRVISHYKKNYLIYKTLVNCPNDPIGAYLAAQSFPSLIEEAVNIQNLLSDKYREVQ